MEAWCSGQSIRPVMGRYPGRISLNSLLLGLKQVIHLYHRGMVSKQKNNAFGGEKQKQKEQR